MSPERREREPERFELEGIAQLAKEVALRDGHHVPMLIAEGSEGPAVLQIGGLPSTHEERARLMRAAGMALAQSGEMGELRKVFFISEAWMSQAGEGRPPRIRPSQDPERLEVLIVSSLEVQTKATQIVAFEMIRDVQGQLAELRLLEVGEGQRGHAESPLLNAFARGFKSERMGRAN